MLVDREAGFGIDRGPRGRAAETQLVARTDGLGVVIGAASPVGVSVAVFELPLATTGSVRSWAGIAM